MEKGKGHVRPNGSRSLPRLSPPASQSTAEPLSSESDSPVPDILLQDTANILEDGRISVDLGSKFAQVFAKLIEASEDEEPPTSEPPPAYSTISEIDTWKLPLSIVLQVVGSRGDVQPFVALGSELQRHGHRVRLATHNVFKEIVQGAGLEFFPIGGDPAELMAYMVKNPGLIPRMKTLREGEIGRKREMIREILDGCWSSCISPDPETENPFVANAIIANPPSFAHVHCAQALGIPLHIMFTMPWTPTRAFPHPLANVNNSNTDPKLGNYISYGVVQLLTWNGIGDVVQSWRNSIDLEDVPISEAPFLMETLKIPHTYCWSPALVPKPRDWGAHIDVCGFLFRNPPPYTPPAELDAFLRAGRPPIYVGFGSIVIDEPEILVRTVLDAVEACGVRAIISKGWSNLDSMFVNEKIFFLGECPHEWLFQRVSAVVHHGGAGTTACGLLNGRPTAIIPFFGDQLFWGHMVAVARAGPTPIPSKNLNSQNLSQAIRYCLSDQAAHAARRVSEKMRAESGVKAAVESFHRHLPLQDMHCDLINSLPAAWECTKPKTSIKLSGAATEILLQSGKIKPNDLRLYRPKPIFIENRRWNFVTSAASVQLEVSYDILAALSGFWRNPRAIHKQRQRELARHLAQPDGSDTSSYTKPETSRRDVVRMVGASAKALSDLPVAFVKGLTVDIPVAVTEGLRNTPKLYGEKVPDHVPITDWKSGLTVAGTTFVHQMAEGLSDIVVQPAKGLVNEGVFGFGKGIGKGALQTLTKPGAACVGLLGYTSQGIYKSIRAVVHSNTKKTVASAHRVQDKYFIHANGARIDIVQVIQEFDRICLIGRGNGIERSSGTATPTSVTRTTSVSSPPSMYELGDSSVSPPTFIAELEAPLAPETLFGRISDRAHPET
ncbi:uncharacterized protein Z518_07851 [Rhinocladiella mackenziei CBS 650.93]|uniref:Rhinocladiella mackenziei CBS 650.93 unplaced genomic scaffold supercont1.6, whole genome shotgun sequence n=1 Tax=Rhinocladiella mackenziei CBS 650.93 TaxID=1442369 RepID=A0A0D2FIS9_9EURO|nr:uncharacterized protein Z518_07851 [Rhinocladiella mackenziei CBS 650.93]KIX01912.1 hypothetical protein Z518_07851 [Rhinocladiella mackenziei CBS 650.93]